MGEHALLSASGAERWMNCTRSPRLEELIEEESSEDSRYLSRFKKHQR
jgi:hypothetical protein